MNKFLAGCLITLAVLVVGGGIAGYVFIFKPASELVGGVMEFAQDFDELNEQIEDKDNYAPGADATVSEQQFERFLAAHRAMKNQLAERLKTLDAKYEELKRQMESENRDMDLGEIAGAYADMGDLIIEAKRAQVAALNGHDFSLDEYTWVRNRVYQAIGASVNVAAITAGGQSAPTPDLNVAEETVALVEPHREELMETYVLAWFGL